MAKSSKPKDIPQLLTGPSPRYLSTDIENHPLSSDIQKVRFYPSGMVPTDISGLGVWVKPKQTISKDIKVLDQGAKWIHIDAPDRELFVSGDHLMVDMDRPIDLGFQKFVSFSSTHQTGDDQLNDRYLINPHSFGPLDMNMRLRKIDRAQTKQLTIVDSGGFQLRSGMVPFVDPKDLNQFYNDNADEGMTLDIPCGGMPQSLIQQCAEIQLWNSKYLMENKEDSVALSNVNHGVEIKEMEWYKSFIDKNETHEFPILSFPSSMELPAVKQLDRLAFLLSNGVQYSQYHMLGLFKISSTMLCARLAHQLSKAGREVFITSDAATAYYSGKWRVYHTLTSHLSMVERHVMGKVAIAGNYTNPYRILACSCEVCSNIKYTDILTIIDKLQVQRLLVRHNEINYVHWLAMLNVYAHELDDNDFKDYATMVVGSAGKAEIDLGLEYIRILMDKGWKEAHKFAAPKTKGLYGAEGAGLLRDTITGEEVKEDRVATKARLTHVVSLYQDYYKIKPGQVPKKTRKKKAA